MGKQWKQWLTLFGGAPKSLQMVIVAMKWKDTYSLEGKLWPTCLLKSRNITLSTKVHLVNAMVFLAVMYGCESWTVKKAECRRIDAFELWLLEKTLESPLDCKEIQPVRPKGDQSWMFTGRTEVEAETPILRPPDAKSWVIWKDADAGKDWRQEEKGTTEDEMVGWHHWLNGHEFGWTPGVGDGQGGLACWGPWGRGVRHNWATELNWSEMWWSTSSSKMLKHWGPLSWNRMPRHMPGSIRWALAGAGAKCQVLNHLSSRERTDQPLCARIRKSTFQPAVCL